MRKLWMLSLLFVLLGAFEAGAVEVRWTPERLLEFAENPGHYIFIGRSPQGAFAFEIKDGAVKELGQIQSGRVVGTNAEIYPLGHDSYLSIPPKPQEFSSASTNAYLVHPNRARERLVRRRPTRTLLATLGLSDRVEAARPRAAELPTVLPPRLPGSFRWILLQNVAPELERQTGEILAAAGCLQMNRFPRRLKGGTDLVACPRDTELQLPDGVRQLPFRYTNALVAGGPTGTVLKDLREARNLLKNNSAAVTERMGALLYILERKNEALKRPVDFEFFLPVGPVLETLEQFSQIIQIFEAQREAEPAESMRNYLDRYWIGPAHAYFATVLTGLDAAGDSVNTTAGRRLVLQNLDKDDGRAWPQLRGHMLDTWLQQMSEALTLDRWVPDGFSLQDLTEKGFKFERDGGLLFPRLGVEGAVADLLPIDTAGTNLVQKTESISSVALRDLGLAPYAAEARTKILNFIIQNDQRVGYDLPRINRIRDYVDYTTEFKGDQRDEMFIRKLWLGTYQAEDLSERPPEFWQYWERQKSRVLKMSFERRFLGSKILVNFVRRLEWPTEELARDPAFDTPLFVANSLDIFNELIENRAKLLRSEGTNLAVLDTAMSLQNILNGSRVGGAVLRSKGIRARAARLALNLTAALASAYPTVQAGGHRETCAHLLAPGR